MPAIAVLGAFGCGDTPVSPRIDVPLDSLRLSPDTLFLRVGEVATFSVSATDTAGQPATGIAVSWSTDDSLRVVISLNNVGRVGALGEGIARVAAASGGAADSAVVVVGPAQNGWYSQISNANGASLNGVFFQPDGRSGWAVGDGGKVVATLDAGAHWNVQTSGTTFNLNGAWFTGPQEGWIVGNGGTVLHTSNGGANWTRLIVNTGENLMDVSFPDPAHGWAVGSNGVILRTNDGGETWTKLYRTGFTLQSVAFSDTSNGWAVGDNGVIVGTHDVGATWFVVQPAVTGTTLNAVWRRSEPRAWAAGIQGGAPRTVTTPDSTEWELRNAGASNQLEGICFPTDLVGFAVGWNGAGAVLRTANGGATWTTQVSNSQYRLNDVFFTDPDHGWAVGVNGTIMHTGTGGAP